MPSFCLGRIGLNNYLGNPCIDFESPNQLLIKNKRLEDNVDIDFCCKI
jgi:hypothetical protein